MQIIDRNKFAEWSRTPEGSAMLVDFLESLPRALSLLGGGASTPQLRLQHALEADGVARNVPLPDDYVEPAVRYAPDRECRDEEPE